MTKVTRIRKNGPVPFGYKVSESDPDLYEGIPEELNALEQAKEYLKIVSGVPTRSSYREVAAWLTAKTGRYLSHMGLKKRVLSEIYSVGSKYYPAKAKSYRPKRVKRKKATNKQKAGNKKANSAG